MRRPTRTAPGFTLVEFLIASVIGVILTAAIVILLRQTTRSSVTSQQTSRITEVTQQLWEALSATLSEAQHITAARAASITAITSSGELVDFQWVNGRLLRNQDALGDPSVEVTNFQFSYFRGETKEEAGSLISHEGLVEVPLGTPTSELPANERERIRLIKITFTLKEGSVTRHLSTAVASRLAYPYRQ